MSSSGNLSGEALKLALAVVVLRSRLQKNPLRDALPPDPLPADESEVMKWKRKAQERKKKLLRVQEDLKEAEERLQYDIFAQTSCKCYFFGEIVSSSSKELPGDSSCPFTDVLRRRFLRQVRLSRIKRKKTNDPGFDCDDGMEELSTSVDFLVEISSGSSAIARAANFSSLSHQAVEFILDSLKMMLPLGRNEEGTEVIINGLIASLIRRMCDPRNGEDNIPEMRQMDGNDPYYYVQHTIRKLGRLSYVGQRVALLVSQRITALAESFLFLDPFEDSFPTMYASMFLLIQLLEFLVADYLLVWTNEAGFDIVLLEEWLISVVHARKSLELLESKNGLYVLYMDRVTGDVAKHVGMIRCLKDVNPEVLHRLFS